MEGQEIHADLSFVSLELNENIKRIRVNLLAKRLNPTKKASNKNKEEKVILPPREKVIVGTNSWHFVETDYTHEMQLFYLNELFRKNGGSTSSDNDNEKTELIRKMIGIKRQGYKQQDMEKQIYDIDLFISLEQIIELLVKSNLCCFYCGEPVHLYYKMAREPKQWSLERIYNQYGHNHGNVEIACLACNVRRSTMHYERYLNTKKMQVVVKL